jgi:hypothetical protein
LRPEQHEPEHKVYGVAHAVGNSGTAAASAAAPGPALMSAVVEKPFSVQCSDVRAERAQVQKLYGVLTEAKKKAGESLSGNMDSFTAFVQKKTEQIRKQYGCQAVEYTVEVQDGHVKLKAKAKS